jgi:hypothetical protein
MYESLPEPLEYEAVPEVPERLTGDIPGLLLHHLLLQLVPHRLQLCLSKRRDSRMRYFSGFFLHKRYFWPAPPPMPPLVFSRDDTQCICLWFFPLLKPNGTVRPRI